MTTNKELEKMVNELNAKVEAIEKKVFQKTASINKMEQHDNGGVEPEQRETRGLRMGTEDKIISMRNAIKILPPNLVDSEGRHSTTNVGNICGFKVSNEMLESAYTGL